MVKKQCKDCVFLGKILIYRDCRGGEGWSCLIDANEMPVYPDMAACDDFEERRTV